MRDCRDLCVTPETELQQVLAVIDRGAVEIVLIADATGRLLGTLTDGDVRRALLRGLPLSVAVAEVMNPRFVSVGSDAAADQIVALMQARGIYQVPVVDGEGRLLGLHILRDLIGPEPRRNWAVIMAGGEGRRLWPITKYLPKPMLMVGGRPLVERLVTQLTACGFQTIFVSIGYLSHQIETHLGDGTQWGCQIRYLKEDRPLGTGGSLTLLPSPPDAPIVVVNGDLLTEVNFAALLDYHDQQQHLLTMCVKEFAYQVPYGVVKLDGRRIAALDEKPTQRYLVNAGIYALSPSTLEMIPKGVEYDLPNLVAALLRNNDSVGALSITEFWSDIGRPEDYDRLLSQTDRAKALASVEPGDATLRGID